MFGIFRSIKKLIALAALASAVVGFISRFTGKKRKR
jgi:hypothetical protein